LYEGNAHVGSSEGEVLARVKNGSIYVDTDDNSNDFIAATPDFHNSSFGKLSFSTGEIIVVAVVEGAFPVINSVEILTDDDSISGGIQINPIPKQNKTVEVESVVSHDSGNDYVKSVVVKIGGSSINTTATAINSTSSVYRAQFNMSYYDSAGNYTVSVMVSDNGGFSTNASASFQYTSLIAMELDTTTLQFAAMPGRSSEILGDNKLSTKTNTTIKNIGNSVFDMELFGTNLSSSNNVIAVNNIQYTFNSDYNNSLAGSLSYSKQTKQIELEAASYKPLSFKLNVPTATTPGNYSGTITLIAVSP